MNFMSGAAGFASGVVLGMPTIVLGGFIGQKVGEYFKVTKDLELATGAAGAVVTSLAAIASMGTSAFYTGVKVAIATGSVLYAGSMSMGAVTINAQKRKANIVETGTYSLKSTLWLVAGAVGGTVVTVLGSSLIHPVAGCVLGSFTAYCISGAGTAFAAVENGAI